MQDAKDKAKDVISKWPNLDDQAKDALNKQIDAGQTVDQVQQIVKDAAKDAVNKLPNLSDKEKQDFNKRIDDAKTTDAINQIVNEVKQQDAKNLQDAKDNGKHVIDQLPNLNDREKDDFKRRVDNGQTIDEINRIVADAKAKNAQNLQDAKNNGKQQIEQLPNLTPNQKQDFKKRIDDASSMMEIQNIVDEATQSNAGQVMTGQQAQLPDTAVNAQSDLGVLGGTMLGLLTLFGLGKRRKREEEK
ncbi:ECM-binding protein homolog [Weissella viridescens]|uniref:ECM-binding protein homolog n=1 Tax=Weissella viridescens TaxID=1629 RepID=A0A380NYI9_WEIVI|nr:ECM-binding protein homolog [Weissella viridescens]